MVRVFVLIALIVAVMYLYMRKKTKKYVSSEINTIEDYHANYDKIRSHKMLRDKQNEYQRYVTKYNSTEDYRESHSIR